MCIHALLNVKPKDNVTKNILFIKHVELYYDFTWRETRHHCEPQPPTYNQFMLLFFVWLVLVVVGGGSRWNTGEKWNCLTVRGASQKYADFLCHFYPIEDTTLIFGYVEPCESGNVYTRFGWITFTDAYFMVAMVTTIMGRWVSHISLQTGNRGVKVNEHSLCVQFLYYSYYAAIY